RRESHTKNAVTVSDKPPNFTTVRPSPEANSVIATSFTTTGGEQSLSIGREDHRCHRIRMAKAQGAESCDGSLRQRLIIQVHARRVLALRLIGTRCLGH